jgi:hypothetical protein
VRRNGNRQEFDAQVTFCQSRFPPPEESAPTSRKHDGRDSGIEGVGVMRTNTVLPSKDQPSALGASSVFCKNQRLCKTQGQIEEWATIFTNHNKPVHIPK